MTKRDVMYRPVVMINVRRLLEWDVSVEALIEGSSFFFDFIVKKLLLPGKVENWIIIIDLDNISLTKIPVKKVGAIITNGVRNFGARLFRNYNINASWTVRKSNQIFTAFIDDITKIKSQTFGDTYRDAIFQYIPKESIEVKYGGTRPNIKNKFFPPDMTENG